MQESYVYVMDWYHRGRVLSTHFCVEHKQSTTTGEREFDSIPGLARRLVDISKRENEYLDIPNYAGQELGFMQEDDGGGGTSSIKRGLKPSELETLATEVSKILGNEFDQLEESRQNQE